MLSTEQLMQKRRKCIALWPWAKEAEVLGKIYTDPQGGRGWEWWEEIGKHPHLFKELQWWEEREITDMPEYVKVNTDKTCLFLGNVLKVRMWNTRPAGHLYCWVEEDKAKSFPDMFKYTPDTFLPATIAEYTAYINQQSPKP